MTQIVPRMSFASKMCVKRSAEKMETVIQMKFVKAFIVWKGVEEMVIAQYESRVKTINVLVSITKDTLSI